MVNSSNGEVSKGVMLVAMDDREHSTHALELTLNHCFLPNASDRPFKLVIVHARSCPPAISLSLDLLTMNLAPALDVGSKTAAARVVQRAKKICSSNSVNYVVGKVVAGDARNVLCDAVRKHKATVLVSRSRGYGVLTRAVLGGVSDYLVHNAQCTVTIVKRPEIKQ